MMNRFKQWFFKLFNRDKPTALESIEYKQYTYKTELQIVHLDGHVTIKDYNNTLSTEWMCDSYELHDPVVQYLERVFKNGSINLFDKNAKINTQIPTIQIRKIVYKPCTITETK